MKPAECTPDVASMCQVAAKARMLGESTTGHVFAVSPEAAKALPPHVMGIAVLPRFDVGNGQCFLMQRADLEPDDA